MAIDRRERVVATLIGYRNSAGPGWQLTRLPCAPENVETRLRKLGIVPDQIRVITKWISRGPVIESDADSSGNLVFDALDWGWTFDERDNSWRAPGDVIDPFDTPFSRCRDIASDYGENAAGWLRLSFHAGDQHVEMHVSDVFCPFADYLTWLETLYSGKHGWFLMNLEGVYAGVYAFPSTDTDDVRIAITFEGRDRDRFYRDVMMTFETVRTDFVRQCYDSFATFAASSRFDPAAWSGADLRNMKSTVLDRG